MSYSMEKTEEQNQQLSEVLDKLMTFCQENNVEIAACPCNDGCDFIQLHIKTNDGFMATGHFSISRNYLDGPIGVRKHNDLNFVKTEGGYYRPATKEEIVDRSIVFYTEEQETRNDD